MELDLLFIVTYECPGCQVELEDRSSGSPAWHRCPKCGRPSLAPEHQRWDREPAKDLAKSAPLIGSFTTGSDVPDRPRPMAPLTAQVGTKSSNIRLLLGFGFFATLFLCVFSLLESNGVVATIAGLASLFCLILLFIPTGQTPND